MMDKIKMIGQYTIESKNILTGEETSRTFKNIVTQGLFSGLFAFLNQDTSAPADDILNLTHIAIGDSSTGATRADVALANETFRKQITTKYFNSTIFTAKLSIGAAEGNPTGGIIKEIGIFAKASATPGSGTLCSRAVVDVVKNSNIQLLITWTLTGA